MAINIIEKKFIQFDELLGKGYKVGKTYAIISNGAMFDKLSTEIVEILFNTTAEKAENRRQFLINYLL